MLGSPAGPGGPAHRGLWPVAPPSIQSATNFTPDGFYSFLPGSPAFGSTLYSHSSAIGRLATATIQPTPGTAFHPAHKVSESLFASTGYTFGAPTPPPGSPYSPVPVTHLDVLAAKGFNSNIIIQQHPEYPPSPPRKLLSDGGGKPSEAAPSCCKKTCCSCLSAAAAATGTSRSTKQVLSNVPSGCSRTNPVNWNLVAIKKEPGAGTPCQVAEVTTSGSPHINATIKVEVASPTQKTCVSNVCHEQFQHCGIGGIGTLPTVVTSNGNIPVGIAVARQRKHQEVLASPSLSPMPGHSAGLLTTISAAQIKNVTRISELDADMGASSGAVVGGGSLLQCPPEERTGGFAGWPVGGTHSSALATPTLWQYPAHLPMEPLVPMPMPPVGFQLVRDHNTGGLLLLPTAGVEQVQQVVWPSYHQPPSHVLLPPSLPPPPLQLLSSSSDYLASSTTMHQQTHSARLLAVTTDKRKLPLPIPTTTFIKIESELSQHKAAQAVSSFDSGNAATTVYTDPSMGPLVTTHVIYQHPPNLILSQNTAPAPDIHPMATSCRSQATSPVTCLTPPPDCTPDEELSVQDASNQTDASECEAHEDSLSPPMPFCKEEVTAPQVKSVFSNSVPEICIQEHVVPSLPPLAATSPHYEEDIPETKQEQVILDVETVEAPTPFVPKDEVVPIASVLVPMCNDEVEIQEDKPVLLDQNAEEAKTCSPDLSGLELLSNSIEEFENAQKIDVNSNASSCCIKTNDEVLERIAQMTLADKPSAIPAPVKDELGGLDLLCALAEQRILEEVNSSTTKTRRFKPEATRKAEKHKLDCDPEDELDLACETQAKHMNISDKPSDVNQRDSSIKSCTCREDSYRTYTTKESEEEAKKFLASRSQASCCNSDWPCMNAMELDMRMRLADLQRKYREKQRELSKLRPKRHEHHHQHRERFRCKKKARKKSINSHRNTTPPPIVDAQPTKVDANVRHSNHCMELLKPPKLCTYASGAETGSCPIRKRYSLDANTELVYKSSKKRKVGRPKKLMSTSGLNSGTETIVAKKLKKGNLVGYLLAAKEKLIQNNSVYSDPPRFVDDGDRDYKSASKSHRSRPLKEEEDTELDEDVEEDDEVSEKGNQSECADDRELKNEDGEYDDGDEEEAQPTTECNQVEELPSKDDHLSTTEDKHVGQIEDEADQPAEADCRCQLTTDHLEEPKLRVLTAMGGLFYAGRLNAVQPPDVYSITLDGERGNRPHIMSQEEILRDAIVEVSPTTTEELPPGTRLCAYWSQQYRCLYPGSVAELEGFESDSKFVSVEFDDGDNGRISIEDIRLLPVDYPIIEYDPNPLLSLSKKRRRTSTVEERRAPAPPQPASRKSPTPPLTTTVKEPDLKPAKNSPVCQEVSIRDKDTQSYKERRRLKKKKRNKFKQKLHDERKKHKKHKYPEESGGSSGKHRKHHKKHHKHKKHHHKKSTHGRKKNQVVEQLETIENCEEKYSDAVDAEVERVSDVDEPQTELNEDVEEVNVTAVVPNVDDEVTMDDILEARAEKSKKFRDRQESCESRSKMSAFLPARQLWGWSGKGYKRPRTKGRSRKQFYRAIQRGKETIQVGDSAVFLSTGRPDRPYIGKIEAMWESCGTMVVKVKWFYHPEETVGCPSCLKYPGALFESPHMDENDVQTISHKCEVLPLDAYTDKLGDNPKRYATIYDNNDIYYLAGYYDPTTTTLKMEDDIPVDQNGTAAEDADADEDDEDE